MDIQVTLVSATDAHIKVGSYFCRYIPDSIQKMFRGKNIYFVIDSLNEIITLDSHKSIYGVRGPKFGIIYLGIQYKVYKKSDKWCVETTEELVRDTMFKFQDFEIYVNDVCKHAMYGSLYEDLYDYDKRVSRAPVDVVNQIRNLKRDDSRKLTLTCKLIYSLKTDYDYEFDQECCRHLDNFDHMKAIENNPVFDSFTENIPFKYIKFGLGRDAKEGFLHNFYKKFDVDRILEKVRNFHPKRYIKNLDSVVYVGSSLLQLFGYGKGADYDIVSLDTDPVYGGVDSIVNFDVKKIRAINKRVSVTAPDGETLDIFKIRSSYCYTVSKFHFPCVKMYIKGDNLFMTPTCMESLYTGNIIKSLIGMFQSRTGTTAHIYEKYNNYGFKFVDS